MSFWDTLAQLLPEVKGPQQRKLAFKEKIKWTLITLVLFLVLSLIPLYGLGQNQLQQFEFLSIILGASFGSIMSLGIGPLVTASIVLQLLNGAQIVKFDLKSHEGRAQFQGIQKILGLFFVLFEAIVYVFMGGLAPSETLIGTPAFFQFELLLVFQLILGGVLVMFMDEVISKWGFGSGISLFIVAGVAQQIFVTALNPLPSPTNPDIAAGAIPALIQSLAVGDPLTAGLKLAAVISTVAVFLIAVYTQAMKIEIPLSFGRVRGQGIRWPLKFFYTSNIPVILVAALLANVQLGTQLLGWTTPAFVSPPDVVTTAVTTGFSGLIAALPSILGYLAIMVLGSVVFAIFWMQTANMDARSQAENIMNSGLQIPGFRRDPRVLESILRRYIWPLTVMGGAAVGLIAALADLTGALSRGTGILLAVMIVYNLYEDIARQHMMDIHPMMKKFVA
ncbi:MAG TPA: preprotein translocase subunit SecY [Candidatus Nanoarchaeia archaeon]|nr:preprotein translocase subunit SecY [Candidatus Nanoarchaeia archaeon]